jgi:hypothetical protein
MDERIDFATIANEKDLDRRMQIIHDQLDKFDDDDPHDIGSLYVEREDREGIGLFFIALGSPEYAHFRWRIQVLRDEWGKEKKPGEYIERSIPVNRKTIDGKLISAKVMSNAKRNGSFSQKYERIRKYKIDEKGCITNVPYDDAAYFIYNWGFNRKTGFAITDKHEYSREPVDVKDHTKGFKKHIHYWRYSPVSKVDYENMPVVESMNKIEDKRIRLKDIKDK